MPRTSYFSQGDILSKLQRLDRGYSFSNNIMESLRAERLLDLSGEMLEELPRSINVMSSLEKLSVKGCNISRLPDTLSQLTALQELDISYTDITLSSVLSILCKLPSLKILKLRGCHVEPMPPAIGKLSALQILDLSETDIISLPDSIGKIQPLKELTLSNTDITSLPDSIGDLSSLQVLYLDKTGIKSLPDSIGKLSELTLLSLDEAKISELPTTIGRLQKLEALFISSTPINHLPQSIDGLKNLQSLFLRKSEQLTNLPNSIGRIASLEKLDLSLAGITAIPESLGNLDKLKELYLTGAKNLKSLPDSIKNLSSLNLLDLSGLHLKKLPGSIINLGNLRDLILQEAVIPEIPVELISEKWEFRFAISEPRADEIQSSSGTIVWCKDLTLTKQNIGIFRLGKDAISDYYLVDKGKRVREVNVFFLGEPNTHREEPIQSFNGKEKIVENRDITGSNMVQVEYCTPVRNQRYSLRLGLWNFTDDAINSDFYRCFLRDTAVYVMVVNASRDINQKVRYMLEKIDCLTGSAEMLLVIRDHSVHDWGDILDGTWLQSDFPNLKQIIRIPASSTSKKEYAPLRKAIIECAKKAAERLEPFQNDTTAYSAASLLRARRARQPFLTRGEAMQLAKFCEVDDNDIRRVIKLCNVLGESYLFNTGKTDVLTSEIVVLNPLWLAEGYNLIKNVDFKNRKLSPNDSQTCISTKTLIPKIKISEDYIRNGNNLDSLEWFLQTIEQYDLAYSLPGDVVYIPSFFKGYLPSGEIFYASKYHRAYQFEIAGVSDIVVSQLSVMYAKVPELQVESYWQTGLWIKREEENVIVQIGSEYGKRQIVQVDSYANDIDARSLFERVKNQLRNICTAFPKKTTEYVLAGGSRFPLDFLLAAHRNGTIEINANDGSYVVSELLSGAMTVNSPIAELPSFDNSAEDGAKALPVRDTDTSHIGHEKLDPAELKPKRYNSSMHYKTIYYSYLSEELISNFINACRSESMIVSGPFDCTNETGKKCLQIKAFDMLTSIVVYSVGMLTVNAMDGENIADSQFLSKSGTDWLELDCDFYGGGKTPIWVFFSKIRRILLDEVINKLYPQKQEEMRKPKEYITANEEEFLLQRLFTSHNGKIEKIAGVSSVYQVDELLGGISQEEQIPIVF